MNQQLATKSDGMRRSVTEPAPDKAFRPIQAAAWTPRHTQWGLVVGTKLGTVRWGHAQFMEVGRELSDGAVGEGWGTFAQLLAPCAGTHCDGGWNLFQLGHRGARSPKACSVFVTRNLQIRPERELN
jgi:hypothetical protein